MYRQRGGFFGSNTAPAAKRLKKFNVFENVYKQMQRTDFTLVSELLIVAAYIT